MEGVELDCIDKEGGWCWWEVNGGGGVIHQRLLRDQVFRLHIGFVILFRHPTK